ncbi:Ger(x)C family spore germination protein [Paenibacillus beijingensis]|uniref:Spore gernimation protein GerC n=1 Tax=Paenibacillus beijingensis TaxID=1126833 RepID=A0A0D5NF43_9BACL|nr:Ger(x)C family spore germination protein [Paenibacillus beijingensis]AJY73538.1 spore gernimation protein GerC [Paenibacillus beijingensis]
MRSFAAFTLSILSLFLFTGCWDKAELTEFGYVQAVAIDQNEEGKIEFTSHLYKPARGGEGGGPAGKSGGGDSAFSIKTKGDTVFEADRDVNTQLGRKTKWDHMRVILIGEELARKRKVGEVLDMFSRNHEPRATVSVLIAKGKASDILNIKPYIEHTIGQQLRKMEENSARFTAKTSLTRLHDLAIQLKSETGVAVVPYINSNNSPKKISVEGIAVLKKGKVAGSILTPTISEQLLMLTNKYKSGIIEFPCTGATEEKMKTKESLEIMLLNTKLTPTVKKNEITVRVMTKIKGAVGELRCSTLKTEEDEKRFEENIEKSVERNLRKAISVFQKRKVDVLGIGDKLYKKNPGLWKQLKPDWNERFAEIRFEVHADVKVLNSGMNVGTPFSKGGE